MRSRTERRRRAWDIGNPGNAAARRQLTKLLLEAAAEATETGEPILDIGCGSGWWLRVLSDAGAQPEQLYGIDADPDRVQAARERLPGAPIGVGDARRLPFEADSFGLVTFIVVLSSLDSRDAVREAIDEAWRVLRSGGVLVCYELRIRKPFGETTQRIPRGDIDARFGSPVSRTRVTLLPPLARRLGPVTTPLYERLSVLPMATSHVLTVHRKQAEPR